MPIDSMPLQVSHLRGLVITHGARERLLSRVDTHVHFQTVGILQHLAAVVAAVGSPGVRVKGDLVAVVIQ